MPYYRGDSYGRGSHYYRGDPFLGALAGAALGGLGKLAGKAVGWVGKQVAGSKGKVAATTAVATTIGMPILQASAGQPQAPITIGPLGINPMAALPGGEPLFSFGGRKKYRRMNVLNPRALKRALRRAEGFEKFARRTVNALRSGPKKFKTTKRRG